MIGTIYITYYALQSQWTANLVSQEVCANNVSTNRMQCWLCLPADKYSEATWREFVRNNPRQLTPDGDLTNSLQSLRWEPLLIVTATQISYFPPWYTLDPGKPFRTQRYYGYNFLFYAQASKKKYLGITYNRI